MFQLFKNKILNIGKPPGTLSETTHEVYSKPTIKLYTYNTDSFLVEDIDSINQDINFSSEYIYWMDYYGHFNVQSISLLGELLKIHPLTLEDILNSDQRTKMEEYIEYLYFVYRGFDYDEEKKTINSNEIHLILGKNYVLSFSSKKHSYFDNVIQRLKTKKGRIRSMKSDYLAYCLFDAVVDHYYLVLNKLSEDIEEIEQKIIDYPSKETLEEIYKIRKELILFRKTNWSLKEMIHNIIKYDPNFINQETKFYIKDLHDHIIQVVEAIEIIRDMLIVSMDSYHTMVNHKNNNHMQFLTGVATIFIPLTLIASIYGMNFKSIPGLESENGFWITIIIMIIIGFFIFFYFKLKKWW